MSVLQNISLNKICPDEFIGFAYKENNCVKIYLRDDYDRLFVYAKDHCLYCRRNAVLYGITFADIGEPIDLVPESPHIDEFFSKPLRVFNGGVVYCRPVNGKDCGTAGNLLRLWLSEVLMTNNVITDDLWHPVIIANACQYQCSEGMPTETGPRDVNFLKLFHGDDVRFNSTELIQRLRSYGSPCKIIVACTKGNTSFVKDWLRVHEKNIYANIHECSLRGCVEYSLMQNGISFVSVGHPCSWYNPKCRKVRKIKLLKRRRK